MSVQPASSSNAGKKAVHVKWAGKTIALGTFPSLEADEKCARAKALTRAWRSTIRPKPSREWVMLELERLGVRVVSGRLGRKAEEDDELPPNGIPAQVQAPSGMALPNRNMIPNALMNGNMISEADDGLNSLMHQARRNSSLGLAMMSSERRGSLGSLGPLFGTHNDPGDIHIPPHRPYKGGGAAAAYEASFHDHYLRKSEEQQRRASSLGLGSLSGGGIPTNLGGSVNPDQHYEMLKLHHMNLLNEIQETTLMMNLYQQQQLQQQQQQLQQQAAGEGNDDAQLQMLLQQQQQTQNLSNQGGGLDHMFNGGQLTQQQRASLGLGGGIGGLNFNTQQLQMQHQQLMQNNNQGNRNIVDGRTLSNNGSGDSNKPNGLKRPGDKDNNEQNKRQRRDDDRQTAETDDENEDDEDD